MATHDWSWRKKRVPTLDCIERDLTPEEALEELIRAHCPSRGLTDFVCIELALDLEPYFREKARTNQEAGGKDKRASKLTKAQRVDTRREVARVADVSSGNVRKVRHILTHACSTLLQAARTQEVSIHLADKLESRITRSAAATFEAQAIEQGLKKRARNLVAEVVKRLSPCMRGRQVIRVSDFVGLLNDTGSIEVEILDVPGTTISVTKDQLESLTPRQGLLLS
jgi:hypothetical protein